MWRNGGGVAGADPLPDKALKERFCLSPAGDKLGRKRMQRGVPQAPSGAGHISADRAYHTDFRGEGLRESARLVGDMVGGGSLVFFFMGRKSEILNCSFKILVVSYSVS